MNLELPAGLPKATETSLRNFLDEAAEILGSALVSVVLFGSAAEGRLRSTSDVNLILVLRDFNTSQGLALQGPLSLAEAAIQLKTMLLLETEIDAAIQCFTQKFADILRRHHVVFGKNPFDGRQVSRSALVHQTRQSLLNLTMRLRERFTLTARSPDQTAMVIADSIGPLRTCAATILELEGQPGLSPKAAFERLAEKLDATGLPKYFTALRAGAAPAHPTPADIVAEILRTASAMRERVERL